MPYFLLILTTLFWSGNFVISRGMHSAIPPLGLSFWRWLVALLILCSFALGHCLKQRALLRRHIRYIAIQGLLGVAGFNTLVYLALQSTTAINAVLVNSCIPVLIGVCSWFMFREAMNLRQWFGVAVSLSGVMFIIARGDWDFLRTVSFNRGDLLMLAACVDWALYSTNLKRYPRDLHPFAYLIGIIICGLLIVLPFYLWEIANGITFQVTPSTVTTILYVALFASVLAFIFWNRAVRTVGANKAGPFIHLMPVFSTGLAVVFLGEQIERYHLFGISLIFAGILMATFRLTRSRG